MPLLKIFSRKALTVSADTLHNRLTKIWKVPNTGSKEGKEPKTRNQDNDK